ncbi:MAG: efflux RND transporter permease subunit [Rhodospirillaceae bacterium]
MKLSHVSIRRPVFATVMSLVIVLVGIVSYDRIPVREYPNVDTPVVNVTTTYKGASAEIVEAQVTQVLEESLAGIEGIDFMTSVNRQEDSQITINFKLNRDPDGAAADVRDRVSRVRGKLPSEIDEPVIQKVEADAQPIMYLAFYSDRHSALEISDYADRYVKDQLQTLPGAAEVRIFGERRYSMRIWLDPERLAAYKLTPQDVEGALRRQNVEVPAGRIESVKAEFTVLSETDLRTVPQFENLILADVNGYLVRLSDVGRAELGPLDERRIARFNGQSTIALGVVKQATANPLEVSKAVREVLPRVIGGLPEGMAVRVAYDKSLFIEESLKNVFKTIGEAVLLVVLIIFVFLRSIRATLIPLVTIPVSIVGTFALMFFAGFSINTLTLLSLVLAIGLVVDDAIVMLENIFRHVEEGMPRREAAFLGSQEIGFAVVAMTLTLAAVYLPIGFMTGKTGRLFTEFAWALAGAVLVSGFVALTLSPMMCSKLLRHDTSHGRVYMAFEAGMRGLIAGYRAVLGLALNHRAVVLLVGLAVAGSSYFIFANLKKELAPYEDQGVVVGIVVAPESATIGFTDSYNKQIEDILSKNENLVRYFVIAGFPTVSRGIAFSGLKPWSERKVTAKDVQGQLMPQFMGVPGVLAFPILPAPLGQSVRSKPVEMVILTSQPYEQLQAMSEAVIDKIFGEPSLINVESDLKLNKPQIRVSVDRDKAADIGVPIETLGRTLETLLGGRQVTRFKREGKQYDVIVQVSDIDRTNPDDLRRIHVRDSARKMIPLSNLVRIEETVAPRELNHFDQLRAATISATLAPGHTLGEALDALERAAKAVLPATAQVDWAGQSRDFKTSSADIYVTFFLALAFIYLVLAAQFESFIDPLVIMLTVPLSITGGLLALYLAGGTLNIYSQVGLVTLIGLITKHGILIVEFSNQMIEDGKSVREAVMEAAVMRLRPILMTTGAMVLGAVPLAFATGAGAVSRHDIGWVIVGGLLVGTFFTLFVIPSVYTLVRGRAPAHAGTAVLHHAE